MVWSHPDENDLRASFLQTILHFGQTLGETQSHSLEEQVKNQSQKEHLEFKVKKGF